MAVRNTKVLLLDEVGEVSPGMRLKLLRALESTMERAVALARFARPRRSTSSRRSKRRAQSFDIPATR
jgi:transcriptional regulator with GAF, ATPase, and Fis domain